MSALANRDFVKMNGLGNEIVVVDLRRAPQPPSAPRRRARRAPAGAVRPADGALSGARAGTDAFVRIYNNDGSEAGACGNGMRCVAVPGQHRDRQDAADFRDLGRNDLVLEAAPTGCSLSTWASRALRWDEIPLAERIPRYARDRSADRPDRHADPAFALGRQHGQSARDLLGRGSRAPTICARSGRCSSTIRSFPSAPTSRLRRRRRAIASSSAPGSAAPDSPRPAARRPARPRSPPRASTHRPQGHGDVAGRRSCHRMARAATTTC